MRAISDDVASFAMRSLDLLLGSFGVEEGVQILLTLVYVRRCLPADWAILRDALDEPGRGLASELRPDVAELVQRVMTRDAPSVHRVCERIEAISEETLAEVFEATIHHRSGLIGRHGGEQASPDWLSDLEVALAGVEGGAVYDPACGFGGVLIAAFDAGAKRLFGTEINSETHRVCQMRMEMLGIPATIQLADSTMLGEYPSVDFVISAPPVGLLLSETQKARWGVKGRDDAGMWLRLAAGALKAGGRAILLCLPTSTQSSPTFREMAASGRVEASFLLPSGAILGTSVTGCLVSLQADPDRAKDILVMDLTHDFSMARKSELALSAQAIQMTSEIVRLWRSRSDLDQPRYRAVLLPRAEVEVGGFRPRFERAPESPMSWPEPAAHLLQALRVSGVKSLRMPQDIPLAPITLLYGPNSVGKSTVMQSLLLLLQSIESSSLITKGQFVDLGTFINAVSGHDPGRLIELGLSFGVIPPWRTRAAILHPDLVRSADFTFGSDGQLDASVREAILGVAGGVRLRARRDDDAWSIPTADVVDWMSTLDDPSRAVFDPSRPTRAPRHRSWSKLTRDPLLKAEGSGIAPVALRDAPSEFGHSPLVRDMEDQLKSAVGLALGQISEELSRLATRLVHLGPVRAAPQRVVPRQQHGRPRPDDFASYLFDNNSAVKEVNEWLQSLGVPYAISILPVTTGGPTNAVSDLLAIVLTDTRSGVDVSPADVGYGVSQVLPIVAQMLQATETVICVEQPELHLHPRLQANLADLLIQATSPTGGMNQVIAETHSEHLLIRLQRRIRERQLDPCDVSVLYVDQRDDGSGAEVVRLRLGPDGEFLDPWPAGFFDDTLDDVLAGWE